MKFRAESRAIWAAALVLSCACESLSAQEERPAVLTNPSAQTRADLHRVVSDALGAAPVRLAEDALTQDSDIIVQHVQPRDAAGLPLNGRALGKPEHLRLIKRGSKCILIHERTGKRWTLGGATCTPVSG